MSNYWLLTWLKHNYRCLSSNWVLSSNTHAMGFYYWHAASGTAAPRRFWGLRGADRKRTSQSAGGIIWAGGSSQPRSQRSHVLMSPPEEGSQICGGPIALLEPLPQRRPRQFSRSLLSSSSNDGTDADKQRWFRPMISWNQFQHFFLCFHFSGISSDFVSSSRNVSPFSVWFSGWH